MIPTGYCAGCCDPCREPTAELANATICEGTTRTLSPTITGTGPFTYQWASRVGADPFVDIPGATSRNLDVTPAETTDYRVTVTNDCGEAQATATVTVNTAPIITVQPVGGVYDGVTPVTLTVTATGSAPLTYQWQSAPTALGPWANIPGATLDTYDAEPEADTFYRVIVTNDCGLVTSDVVEVEIPALLVEYSETGDDWVQLDPDDALNLGNLAGLQFRLRFTSNVECNVTGISSTVPQVQAGPAVPINVPAATPTVALFTNTDPGVTAIGLTFDIFPALNFQVMCYTLAGVIRTVGNAGVVPGAMIVAFAIIEAADVAAAVGYATPELALAASGAGDWIVGVEAAEFVLAAELNFDSATTANRLCSLDSVAPTLGRYGDGFRLNQGAAATTLIRLSVGGSTVRVHDVGLSNPGAGDHVALVDGANASLLIDRCRLKKEGNFEISANVGAGSTYTVANSYIECGAGANGVVCAAGDESARVVNCTIISIAAAGDGVFGSGAGQRVQGQGTYTGVAAGGASFATGGWNANVTAGGAGVGGNGSSDATAPGTTTYHTLPAASFITDDAVATLNMAPIDRATLALYPCPSAAAIGARDVDKTPRTDWLMGAKWIAP